MPKIITSEFLKTHGACADQIALFADLYPDGTELVPGSLLRAAEQGLNVDWLAKFLSELAECAYNEATAPAKRAYREVTASAQCAYDEARASARRVCDEATTLAERAYREARAAAKRAYNEATASARCARDEAIASAECAFDEAIALVLEQFLPELIAA